MATPAYLELGDKRVFACALDWPGWCRSGTTEAAALEALVAYVPRYALVAKRAGLDFPADVGDRVAVVERLPGSAGTDFGVPSAVAAGDGKPVSAAEAERQVALLRASWAVFDHVVATAPAELRKGPRGGGRDRDKIADHVLGAEAAYARKLGIKQPQPAPDDRAAITALRDAIAAALGAPCDGAALVPKGWPPRYAARRIAWHVLDHAWEIQDRSQPAG
jgi:hypothetical protein